MWIRRRRGGKTAKELGRILSCRATYKKMPRYRTFIINYGDNCQYAHLNRNVNSDKLRALNVMKEAGIKVPNVYYKEDQIGDDVFPVLCRRRYHTQGNDIIFIKNREELNGVDWNDYDYLVKYVPKKSEYRVHVLGRDRVMVSVKFNDNEDSDGIVRSHGNGWRQIEYDRQYKEQLIELGRRAVDALGYDFGAVDIIRSEDNELYVLEVNASPGLEPRKLKEYADYFAEEERKWRYNEY